MEATVRSFTSLDLQQQSGEIQRAALLEPVVVTNHGEPRSVVMSVEEYIRLKEAADEPVAPLSRSRPVVQRGLPPDPLGYDTSDIGTCVRAMADDALNGRHKEAIQAELVAVERRLGYRP